MMKVRPVHPGDYAAAEQLLRQLQDIHAAGRPELYPRGQACLNEFFFSSMLTNEDMIALVAEQQRRIIGICIASMLNYSGAVRIKTVCIDQLVVDKACRRSGVGSMLLRETARRAGNLGAKRMDLTVWSFNQDAIQFYEHTGMTPQRIIYEQAL